ncbi:MAG TPA: hypothetical protein VMI33_24715 [Streptosporangiaceae bacterium]|nr:hypothetical protein [Streptosporangiaceae bacterium]
METSPGPWIEVLRHSHVRLQAVAGPLTPGQLQQPPDAAMPAEAFVRLIYGRVCPACAPPIKGRQAHLDELRQIFPGL